MPNVTLGPMETGQVSRPAALVVEANRVGRLMVLARVGVRRDRAIIRVRPVAPAPVWGCLG